MNSQLIVNLNKLRELKRLLRDYSDIYDVYTKLTVAEWFGLPFDIFLDYSFEDWVQIRDKWDYIFTDISSHIKEIAQFHHINVDALNKIPMVDIKDLYYIWAEHVNYPVWKPILRSGKIK